MKCLIRQPSGIGDIFFCQKIADHYSCKYDIIWPLKENLMWIKDYLIGNNILYIPEGQKITDFEAGDITLDLQNACRYIPGSPLMEAKYMYANVDVRGWDIYFNFKRKPEKEEKLFKEVLGLKEGEPYIFKSIYFGTPPCTKALNIQIPEGIKVVSTESVPITNGIPEYTVIDWCKTLENASEIYMVDTCYNYILEKLNLKAKKIHLYSRFQNGDFSHINGLFKVKYTYEG